MADRYLLESGSPDGYLLEDSTGVLLLEGTAAASPFFSSLGVQPGITKTKYSNSLNVVANLLLTTLAVAAVSNIPRAPLEQQGKRAVQIQAFQPPNLLLSTLTPAVVPIPVGRQQTTSAPITRRINEIDNTRNAVLLDRIGTPVGRQQTLSAPYARTQLAVQLQGTNLSLQAAVVQPFPPGVQQTSSSPFSAVVAPTFHVPNVTINLPVAPTAPVGQQQTSSTPYVAVQNTTYVHPNLVLSAPRTYTLSIGGTITFSGTLLMVRERAINPTGDITFSGAAIRENTNIIEPSGILTFSGTGSMQFVPAAGGNITSRLPMTGAGIT